MIGARAETWARQALALWRTLLRAVVDNFAAERGRWTLWVPVAVGAGAALYFELPLVVPLWAMLLGGAVAAAGLCGGRIPS